MGRMDNGKDKKDANDEKDAKDAKEGGAPTVLCARACARGGALRSGSLRHAEQPKLDGGPGGWRRLTQ